MGGHGPARHEEDEAGNEVALRVAIAIAAQPDADQSSGPPYDAHGRVLPVILNPGGAPTVFGKGVDAAPCGNNGAVVEFLRTTRLAHPDLSDEKDDGEHDAVSNEGTAHDEMGRTLSNVVPLTEAERRDATKNHLRPRENGHSLADDGVAWPDELADLAINSLLPVALQVKTENNLACEQEL